MGNNIPRRHHFLPQSYLEGFTKDGKVWIYDRSKNEFRRQTPKNIAFVRDFYAFEDTSGAMDYGLEKWFSTIEGKAKASIRDLEQKLEITPGARLHLAFYISLLMVRTPKFDREVQETADAMLKGIAKQAFQTVESAEIFARQYADRTGDSGVTGESLFRFVQDERFKVVTPRNNVLIAMLTLAERVTFDVAMMDWMVVHADPRTAFITSDEPIGYIVPQEFLPTGEPVLGLGSQKVVKIVPLSQSIALLLGKFGGGFGHFGFHRERVRDANLRIAVECGQHVIGCDETLLRVIVKRSGIDKGDLGSRMKLEHIQHPTDPHRSFVVNRRVMVGQQDRPFKLPESIKTNKRFPQHFALEDNQKVVLDFEALLRQYNMQVSRGSPLEDASLAICEMLEIRKNKEVHNKKLDCRERWRQGLFLADVARKVLYSQSHPDFKNLLEHVRLLLEPGNFSQFSAVRLTATSVEKDANNKVFELYIAAILFRICSNLEFDSPARSTGKNPDAIGEFKGRRWGIACKVSHTENPLTFLERVREGVEQIEKSDIDRGVVIVNMKNLVPHDITWPARLDKDSGDWQYVAFPMSDDASMVIDSTYEKLYLSVLEKTNGPQGFDNIFAGKKTISRVLVLYCTVTSCSPRYGVTIPTIVKKMMVFGPPLDTLNPDEREFLELINDYLHDRIN